MLAHGMSLNLGQSLVSHALCLCSIFVPEHLAGMTHLGAGFVGEFVSLSVHW